MAARRTLKKGGSGNGAAGSIPTAPNPELIAALHDLERDRNLSFDVLIEALEAALVSAYKRNFAREAENVGNPVVVIDRADGSYRVFARRTVVEEVNDALIEVSPSEAGSAYKLGDNVDVEVTPKEFGRIAAQTAKQVIVQRIREAERDMVFDEFHDKIEELAAGTVLRYEQRNMFIDFGKAEAILPVSEQVPHEAFRIGQRIRVYVMEARKTNRGPQIIVSRAHPNVVRRFFEQEVPEVAQGSVEVKDVAREPGSRSKVSVWTDEEDIDAVGACLGPRSSRVNNITEELHGEKIDVIQWSADTAAYVANALAPAKVIQVHLNEREHLAEAVVPDYQLSLAIGKEGQNVRLAARLTGWRIDIHNEEQWAEVVEQRAEEAKELEEVAVMAEVAANETGVELTPELLAADEDLIRKLQELQRASGEPEGETEEEPPAEDAGNGAQNSDSGG
ncbi:MAG: transcription termination/antitermination protein NusA [Candidatus Eremiobacteraeota bacterium]|nr:transcription termination/antitermination protein NusA [Candidatus Eremiobacteraeota bacterium]MBC5826225.1 transcription termination/antitermination protein NusA [Candidatus Eremiobacteraeota bacterium]